jgi:hypothetical protein
MEAMSSEQMNLVSELLDILEKSIVFDDSMMDSIRKSSYWIEIKVALNHGDSKNCCGASCHELGCMLS